VLFTVLAGLLISVLIRPLHLQVVDSDTQKAMLAWYYKKQEEEKVCSGQGG